MLILTINSRMNSLKFNLFKFNDKVSIASGLCEGIGSDLSKYTINYSKQIITEEITLDNHHMVAEVLLDKFISLGIIEDKNDIKAIGHRIVNGGEKYKNSTIINEEIIDDILNNCSYVPFYQKANVLAIEAFRDVFTDVLNIAVFDTSFYQNMDTDKFLYSVPYNWYSDYGIRKYGAHGIVHKYVTNEVKNILNNDNFKLISCHIGNGVSISAIENMRCVDTSIGFTPVSGAMMSTRSGDIDPSIIPFIMEKEGKNALEVLDDLNKKSGLFGVSLLSDKVNEVFESSELGDDKSLVAKKMYINSIVDFIAKYYVLLNGCDILSFTGGVIENNLSLRREICERLTCLGVKIDLDKNIDPNSKIISSSDSSVKIFILHKDEELFIAQETFNILNR